MTQPSHDALRMTNGPRVHISFVIPNAFPLYDPTVNDSVGGLETRAHTFAAGLAKLDQSGVKISVVVSHPRARAISTDDGVDVIPFPRSRIFWMRRSVGELLDIQRRPLSIRLRQWKACLLWQLPWLVLTKPFRRADPPFDQPEEFFAQLPADVLVAFGANEPAAQVVISANASGKCSVLMLGSNDDLDQSLPDAKDGAEPNTNAEVSPYRQRRDIAALAVKRADLVVAQTTQQQMLLKQRFQRDCVLIANPLDFERWDQLLAADGTVNGLGDWQEYVLWVGRADDFHKRPELCLAAARACPDVRFVMVLNPGDPAIERHIRNSAPANVRIIRRVPFEQMPVLFRHAAVFFSTGAKQFEGAPNVFQQAAASRVPIVSLEAGAEFIEPYQCGTVCRGELPVAIEAIRVYINQGDQAQAAGNAGRYAVEQHHSVRHSSQRLLDAIEQVMRDAKRQTSRADVATPNLLSSDGSR